MHDMNFAWLLVAAVYAGALALSRRLTRRVPWRIATLFYLLVLLFLFRPLTGRYTNLPTDVVELISPWSAGAPPGRDRTNVSNHELQDVVFQMTPWAHQVRESWRSLEVPLWNGLSGTGQPLLANMQSAALSPLRLLALPLPLGYAMAAEAAMKILVALVFMFLYLRRRYDEVPSGIGAIAFGLGGYTIVWLHFPHATVAVFLPAVLYAIDLLAEQRTFGRFVFAAMLGPLLLFGGHPETTAHVVFFATVYAVWVAFVELREGRLAFIRTLAGICIVSALLAAPLLVPFLESMRNTVRYVDLKERPHAEGTAYSDFTSLVPLFQPRFYGTRPGPAWSANAKAETLCGFAGFLGIAAWFGLLARAIVRREWRSREPFFVIATLMAFAILDDWPYVSAPFRELFHLALNSRMRLVFMFLAAAQTAALLHHGVVWGSGRPRGPGGRPEAYTTRGRLPVYATIAGGLGILAFLYFRTDFPSVEAKHVALLAMIPSVVTLLLIVRPRHALVGAALVVELWLAGHAWNPVRPLRELYPSTPLIEALHRERGTQLYRTAGITGALFPNTHALFGIEDARVHDAMSNARYAHALSAEMTYDPLEYYPKFKDPDAAILDRLNVKWVVTEPGVTLQDATRYRLVYSGKDGGIYENRYAWPRFTGHAARIDVLRAANDNYSLRVTAEEPTMIRASIAFWPGWRVTYSGRALKPRLVDGAFIGFMVPKGVGEVRLRYAPVSFWGSVAVALATIIGLGVRWQSHRFRTRRSRAPRGTKAAALPPHS
jgi:hypothetical protein